MEGDGRGASRWVATNNDNGRQRAVASGTIFGGVDCYVLGDGSTVLSQSGMIRGLRGKFDVHDSANLTQYLARLPEKYSELSTCTSFEFVLPDGGVAIGRPARDFVAMCRAYAEMYAEGTIHKARIPIARNCIAILAGLADLGIDELVYRASGYRPAAIVPQAPAVPPSGEGGFCGRVQRARPRRRAHGVRRRGQQLHAARRRRPLDPVMRRAARAPGSLPKLSGRAAVFKTAGRRFEPGRERPSPRTYNVAPSP